MKKDKQVENLVKKFYENRASYRGTLNATFNKILSLWAKNEQASKKINFVDFDDDNEGFYLPNTEGRFIYPVSLELNPKTDVTLYVCDYSTEDTYILPIKDWLLEVEITEYLIECIALHLGVDID